MGAILKVVDVILFTFFMIMGMSAPLIDSQSIFPRNLYPDVLVDVKQWMAREHDNYLLIEMPSFYVGIAWLVVLFLWPLSLLNLYGLLSSKSWYPTTCLMCGVSVFTSVVAILAEIIGSGRASDKLISVYLPLLIFGILATLRGLVSHSGKNVSVIGQGPAIARKKRV